MSRVLVLLFALIQADLPVHISAAGVRNAFRGSYGVPAGGYGVSESPAGSEEEEEDEDDGDVNSKEQVLQVVQAASAQAPDAQQKQAFLAWLAAGRKVPPAVVSTIEPPTMRPLQVAGYRSQVAAGYPTFQQASPAFDFPAFALSGVAKADVTKQAPKGVAPAEVAPAKGAVAETTVAEDGKGAAKGGTDADDDGGNATAVEGGDNSCHPACAEGRGLCSDKVCFCRSPYTGVSCEKFREVGSVRFSYEIVAAILVFAMVIGSILGINTFKLLMGVTADNTTASPAEAASNTKETWRPAQGASA